MNKTLNHIYLDKIIINKKMKLYLFKGETNKQ